jgi:hypothetical protein
MLYLSKKQHCTMKSDLLKLLKPRLRANVIAFASVLTHLTIISQNSWLPLSTGVSHNGSWLPSVNAMTVWNNKLVVGGAFTSAGGNNTDNVALWDGNNWSTLATGVNKVNNQDVGSCFSLAGGVTALTVYQGNLIAAGEIYASGVNTFVCVAKWNGNNWGGIVNKLTLSEQGTSAFPCIRAMTVYNNKLIIAGLFDSINNIKAKNIAQWNGVNWSPVGNNVIDQGVNISYKGVFALEVYNNELYVGGNFTSTLSSQTTSNIVKWNETNWQKVGNGIPFCLPQNTCKMGSVNCMKVYNSELYVGNCNAGISKWDGSTWSNVGGGIANGYVFNMHVYDNKLIVAGGISIFGINNFDCGSIVAWDGVKWMPIGNSPDDFQFGIGDGNPIYALMSYNNSLYLGGWFGSALSNVNFIYLNNITRYAGTTIGIKENSLSQKVQVSPNPSTGQFTFEGLTENCSVEVTDLTGRLILYQETQNKTITFNLEGKAAGGYLYKVKNELGVLKRGKLILVK